MKFWIRCKWGHTCKCKKHFTPDSLGAFLLILWWKNFLQSFMMFLTILSELTKFWMIKLCQRKVIQAKNIKIKIRNIPIVTYLKIYGYFADAILFFDGKRSFKKLYFGLRSFLKNSPEQHGDTLHLILNHF